MKSLLRLLTSSLLVASASTSILADDVFRSELSAPIFFSPSAGGGTTTPLAIQASIPHRPVFAMVGEQLAIGFTKSGGQGELTATLTGDADRLSISGNEIIGSILNPGPYSYGIVVDDEGAATPVSVGPYSIEIDPILSVGNLPSVLNADTSIVKNFDLPSSTGYATVLSLQVESGSDTAAKIEGDKLRVLHGTTGTAGTYRIIATDGRNRTVQSDVFEVRIAPPVVKPQYTDDTYIDVQGTASLNNPGTVLNGGTVASNTSYRSATTRSDTSPSIYLEVGYPLVIKHTQIVEANGIRLSFITGENTSCNNGAAASQLAAGQPQLKLMTSADGTTWHNHTQYAADFDTGGGCGTAATGRFVRLDDGHRQFQHMKLEVVSSRSRTNAQLFLRVSVFRASQQ